MRFKKSLVTLFALIIILGGGTYVAVRHFQMVHLYELAISPDSRTAKRAIRTLGRYRGMEATDLLSKVAISPQGFIDTRQVVAIESISGRNDASALAVLSGLLQPHFDLARRAAVAAALARNPCPECVTNILHYEERLTCGTEVKEEATIGDTDDAVTRDLMAIHDHLVEDLNRALLLNSRSTLRVLSDTYGLGSSVPSAFALQVVRSLHLRSACPLVAKSKGQLLDLSQEGNIGALLKILDCPPGAN